MKFSLNFHAKEARGFEAESPPEVLKFSANLASKDTIISGTFNFAPQFEVNWEHIWSELENLMVILFELDGLSVAVWGENTDDDEISDQDKDFVTIPCADSFFSGIFQWEGWINLPKFGDSAQLLCSIKLSDSLFLYPDDIVETNLLTITNVLLKNPPLCWLNDEEKSNPKIMVSFLLPFENGMVEFETALVSVPQKQEENESQEKEPSQVTFSGHTKRFLLDILSQQKLRDNKTVDVQLRRAWTVTEDEEEKNVMDPLKAKGVLSIEEVIGSVCSMTQVQLSVEEDKYWMQLLENDKNAKEEFETSQAQEEKDEDAEPPQPSAVDIFAEASSTLEMNIALRKPLVTESRKRIEFAERFNPPETPEPIDPEKQMEDFSETYLSESINKLRVIFRSMQKECSSDTDIVIPDDSIWMYKMNKEHISLQTEIKHNLSIIAQSKLRGTEEITEVHQVILKEVRKALDRDIENFWKPNIPERTLEERVTSAYFEKLALEMFKYQEWANAWDFLRRIPENELSHIARDCLAQTALRISRDNDRMARKWILQNTIEKDAFDNYGLFTLLLLEADLFEDAQILLDHLRSSSKTEQHRIVFWWLQAIFWSLSENESTKMAINRARLYDVDQKEAKKLISAALNFNAQRCGRVLLDSVDKNVDTYILEVQYHSLSVNPYSHVESVRLCKMILDHEDDEADHIALAELGHSAYRIGKADEAVDFYRRHLGLCPGTAESFQEGTLEKVDTLALYRLGLILLEKGKATEAKEAFLQCLEINRECSLFWHNLAKAQVELREYRDALMSFRAVNRFNLFLNTVELSEKCTLQLELIEASNCLDKFKEEEE